MSYACPVSLGRVGNGFFDFEKFLDDNTGIGEESGKIQESFGESIEHYLRPILRQWADPFTRFLKLKHEWEADTAALSSITEIAMHPAYQQIIGMGPIVVSLIIREMVKEPNHWFWALKSITGEDPVTPEKRGRIREMTEAWLLWWRKKGH